MDTPTSDPLLDRRRKSRHLNKRFPAISLLSAAALGASMLMTVPTVQADTVTALFGGDAFGPGGNLGYKTEWIRVAPNSPRAYAGGTFDDTLVIDTTKNKIIGSIPGKSFSFAISPDGSRAYRTMAYGGGVDVIDLGAQKVIGNVPMSSTPMDIALNSDGSRAYVVGYGDEVTIVDTRSQAIAGTIDVGGPQSAVALTPDGSKLFVGGGSGGVSVIDTAAGLIVETIAQNGSDLAVTPDGARLYVAGLGYSVYDARTNALVGAFEPDFGASSVAITPDGSRAYMTGAGAFDAGEEDLRLDPSILVVDTATNTTVDRIRGQYMPNSVAFTSNSRTAYAVGPYSPALVLEINATPVQREILPTTPNGVVGQSYDGEFLAMGFGPAKFTLTGGELPPGVKWMASEHSTAISLSGVPTKAGTYTFTVTADNLIEQFSNEVTITITDSSIPGGGDGCEERGSLAIFSSLGSLGC